MFRRRSGLKRQFQSKQFNITNVLTQNVATAQILLSNDIVLSPDKLLGVGGAVQASMKRCSIVGIDYYFTWLVAATGSPTLSDNISFAHACFFKDTLDSTGATPDGAADEFLFVNQVDGGTNQQLFPERIIDRFPFAVAFFNSPTTLSGNSHYTRLGSWQNPLSARERRVRRRVSFNNREALCFRVEVDFPTVSVTATSISFVYELNGVVTYRMDL